jgi:ATP-dependent DNA helicase RecQ
MTYLDALRKYFGFNQLREGQKEIISAVMRGEDCLAILPTGAGKSLCFQLPSLLKSGLTLVVSPLIALMKDQVDSLTQCGIPATYINSSLDYLQLSNRLDRMARGGYQLVYVAPERFRSERFLSKLSSLTIDLLAVDEAHCISLWGHDFRPDYQRLNLVRKRLNHPQVIALTATATEEARRDIIQQLDLDTPTVIVRGFERPNLTLAVSRTASHAEKYSRAMEILKAYPTGIVYCATRANVEKVAAKLDSQGIRTLGYHAGMSDEERKEAQDRFLSGKVPVVVATNAFGMGIDRADLRTIIHWDLPGSLEAYYQEAGRAGRDGNPAHCEILFNYADVRTQKFFIEGANPPRSLVRATARAVQELCAEGPAALGPKAIADKLGNEDNLMAVSTALGLLEQAGLLLRTPDPGSPGSHGSIIKVVDPKADLGGVLKPLLKKAKRDRLRLRNLIRYIDSRSCRHATILRYFGDPAHEKFQDCRRCDNCLPKSGSKSCQRRAPNEQEWVEIQKVLSCAVRLGGRFGKARLTQVLAGSKNKTILNTYLHKISTYGALADRSQNYIRALIDALQDEECLEVVGDEYPTLKISSRGRAVMRREEEIEISRPKNAPEEPTQQSSAPPSPCDQPVSPQLVEALKTLRTKLAKGRKIPPYRILHNTTLQEIARRAPRDRAALLEVKGMGPAKLEAYGDAILAVVREYR